MTESKKWVRPTSVPFPTVWAHYESKKPLANGRRARFRIQDYTQEWRDHLIRHMTDFFLREESLSQSLDITSDPVAVEEYFDMVSDYLQNKMVLIALVENAEELEDEDLPVFAGCNITGVTTNYEKTEQTKLEVKSEKNKKIIIALEELKNKINCFEVYGTNEILYSVGLSVDGAYRGLGLGTEILKAREPLCRAVGITAAITIFTSTGGQQCGRNAGYELLAETFYEDWKDENGEIIFKLKNVQSMQLMGLKYL